MYVLLCVAAKPIFVSTKRILSVCLSMAGGREGMLESKKEKRAREEGVKTEVDRLATTVYNTPII